MKALLITLFTFGTLLGTYQVKDYSHLYEMKDFDKSLIETHLKLYAGYVKNTNILCEKMQYEAAGIPSYQYGALKRRFGWEFDGMRLHELYFENLGGKGVLSRKSPLFLEILKQFQSFEKWREDFIATGTIRGIGWALLYLDRETGLLYNTWINEHDTGPLFRGTPLLIMDVWEHAFLTQFGLDKVAYIERFLKNVNWNIVEKRYSGSD